MEEIILGTDYLVSDVEKKDAQRYIGYVKKDIEGIKSGFIRLGFHLDEIQRLKIYQQLGYEDFYEFCEMNFRLSKSSISKYIKVFKRFCAKNGESVLDKTNTMYLDKLYEGYTYSQLYEMVNLSEQEIYELKISPAMSEKRIRELVKAGHYIAPKPKCSVSSTKQEEEVSMNSFVDETELEEPTGSFVDETKPESIKESIKLLEYHIFGVERYLNEGEIGYAYEELKKIRLIIQGLENGE